MTKEKMLEILNKKIEVARKDFAYWNNKYQISFARLDVLKDRLDELLALEPEEGESEKESKNEYINISTLMKNLKVLSKR